MLERYYNPFNDKSRHHDTTSSAYWMNDRCKSQIQNLISVKLCKYPGMNNHFSSVVPIFYEGYDDFPLRNKYCSECNYGEKEETNRNYWDLSIKCVKRIEFNHENLMHVVQENKCMVYFQPPLFTFAQPCTYLSDYTISKCNVTGLWNNYGSFIEAACHSFIDSFNKTYKNYFCYLCNTDNPGLPEQWSCESARDQKDETLAPGYYIKLSAEVIGGIENSRMLGCDPDTQFIDLKQVIPLYI